MKMDTLPEEVKLKTLINLSHRNLIQYCKTSSTVMFPDQFLV